MAIAAELRLDTKGELASVLAEAGFAHFDFQILKSKCRVEICFKGELAEVLAETVCIVKWRSWAQGPYVPRIGHHLCTAAATSERA